MKKFKLVFFLFFISLTLMIDVKADIVFTSTPDSTAFVGELYNYQVTVAYDGTAPAYSLVEKPTGMTIGSSTGLISWTPTAINQGGRVVVKATNSTTPEKLHTYFVYITDAIECPSKIVSYWKLDETTGPVFADYISGNDAIHGGTEFTLYDTAGVVDYGQRFKPLDQDGQFLVVNDVNDYNWSQEDTFAISLWFKWDGTKHPSQNQMLVGRSGGNNMIALGIRYFGTQGQPVEPRVMFRVEDYQYDPDGPNPDDHMKEVSTNGAFTLNTDWHHVVAEFIGKPNGQTQILNLYYDKVNVGGDAQYFSNFQMDESIKLYMGYWNAFGENDRAPFSGVMDEIAVYNKVLGTAGVTKLYNDGIARKPQCQPGNYAPVITSSPAKSVNEDTPYSYTLTFRDIDGDAITKSAKILPKWLTFNTSSGVLSGIPLNKNVGDTVVSLAINDGKVEIVQTYTLTVVNVNDPPVRKSTAPTAVNEDVLYSYTFVAEDVDVGDQITLSIQGTLPSWLNFTDNGNGTGLLSGTPNNDAVGYDPFRDYNIVIRATDKAAAYIQESFVIRVTNINDAPVITGQAVVATDEDVPLTITLNHLIVTDVDNVYPTDFTLVVHNGSNYTRVGNTITPALNYSGGLIVPVTISDGDSSKNYNLNVTVNPVNDPPVFTTTPVVTAKENVNYLYIFIATDVDDATLNYAYDKKPEWLTFTSTTSGGSLTGIPGNANVGKDSVVIKVTDSKATTYQRFIIDVENVNDKPAFSSTPVTTGDDYELYSYTLTGTDNDPNDVLSFFGKTLPSWLSVVKQEGVTKLTGTPQHVNVGNNPVVIGLTDSYDTVYQSFTIVVGNINSLPVVESVPELTVKVGNPYAYQLVVTDLDADDVITIAPTTIPSWLTYDAATKILSGLPGAATPSTNNVLFTIGDGRGQITHAFTISVVITGINDYTSSASIIHNLYPVPADKELTVEFNDAQSCNFQIININGRIVKNIEVLNQSRIIVDVSDLMPNVYFFKIMKGSEIQVGKIVIE